MIVELPESPVTVPFFRIECDHLDGENASWARQYLAKCQSQLEALADSTDPFRQYLAGEIAAWEDLLGRFTQPVA